ncbi:glycoside hydrolase family 18 protein, partial [Glonium stellatum]
VAVFFCFSLLREGFFYCCHEAWALTGWHQVAHELGGHDYGKLQHRPNHLEYPHSKYDNLRKGFPGEEAAKI